MKTDRTMKIACISSLWTCAMDMVPVVDRNMNEYLDAQIKLEYVAESLMSDLWSSSWKK